MIKRLHRQGSTIKRPTQLPVLYLFISIFALQSPFLFALTINRRILHSSSTHKYLKPNNLPQDPRASGEMRRSMKSDLTDDTSTLSSPPFDVKPNRRIKNFRMAASLPRIYRCASTDVLADMLLSNDRDKLKPDESDARDIVFERAGLILDLRSPSERDEKRATYWMERCALTRKINIETFERSENNVSNVVIRPNQRTCLRIDVLSPSRLFDHMGKKWFDVGQKFQSALHFAANTEKLHSLRMDVLNERGLAGLYECMIETSKAELFAGLCAITEYLESIEGDDHENGAVIVHCVQGKDRTGLLIMLCQSIIGLSDEEIICDYHLSEKSKYKSVNAAASTAGGIKGKLDRRIFGGSPREAMSKTLSFIKEQYGSVSPGYLDVIGFHKEWRIRFMKAVIGEESTFTRSRI